MKRYKEYYTDYFTCIGEEDGDEFFFAYTFDGTVKPLDKNGNTVNEISQAKPFKRLANAEKFGDKHGALAGDTEDFVVCIVQMLPYSVSDIVTKETAYQAFIMSR
jgi:hypothetical protein